MSVLFAQRRSFCTCVCTWTHQQEKQSRPLILHSATSHLWPGTRQPCPKQGPAGMEIISRRDTAAKNTHPLLSASAPSSSSASTGGSGVREQHFAELLRGIWSSARGKSHPRGPHPTAEPPLGRSIPLAPAWRSFTRTPPSSCTGTKANRKPGCKRQCPRTQEPAVKPHRPKANSSSSEIPSLLKRNRVLNKNKPKPFSSLAYPRESQQKYTCLKPTALAKLPKVCPRLNR